MLLLCLHRDGHSVIQKSYPEFLMSRLPLLSQVVDLASAYFDRRDSSRSFPGHARTIAQSIRRGTARAGARAGRREVIAALAQSAELGLVAHTGPRYFGFVIGGSLPVATAADWLTSAWDQNSGLYATSPAASVVEEVAARLAAGAARACRAPRASALSPDAARPTSPGWRPRGTFSCAAPAGTWN